MPGVSSLASLFIGISKWFDTYRNSLIVCERHSLAPLVSHHQYWTWTLIASSPSFLSLPLQVILTETHYTSLSRGSTPFLSPLCLSSSSIHWWRALQRQWKRTLVSGILRLFFQFSFISAVWTIRGNKEAVKEIKRLLWHPFLAPPKKIIVWQIADEGERGREGIKRFLKNWCGTKRKKLFPLFPEKEDVDEGKGNNKEDPLSVSRLLFASHSFLQREREREKDYFVRSPSFRARTSDKQRHTGGNKHWTTNMCVYIYLYEWMNKWPKNSWGNQKKERQKLDGSWCGGRLGLPWMVSSVSSTF